MAHLAKLEEGFDRAGRLAEKQAAQIERSFSGLKVAAAGLGGVIAGAFSVVAMQQFFTNAVNGIDALNDLKDATGASIENISALEDVALRTGSSFETVSTALVKLNGVLNEAKPGSAQAETLKAIGLSAEELRKLDPAEAMLRVAQALDKFADDGNKARIVQDLFGKSIKEVAPLLKDLAEKGRLVGTVTKEQADEAEKFNKQLAELQKNSTDTARSLVGSLLPALNRTFEGISAFGGLGGVISDRLGLNEQGQLTRQAAAISAAMDRTTASIERMQEELNRRGGSDQFLETRIRSARERLKALDREAADVSERLRGVADKLAPEDSHDRLETRRLSNAKRSVGGVPGKPDKATKPRTEKLVDGIPIDRVEAFRQSELAANEAVNKALADSKLSDFAKANEEAAKAQKHLNDLIAETPTAKLEAFRKEVELLENALASGVIDTQQFEEAKKLLEDKLQKPLQEMDKFSEQAARNIQDALGDTLVKSLEGDFGSIEKLWANMLKRMVSEALAADLNKALFGDGKPSLSGLMTNGGILLDKAAGAFGLGEFFGAENPSSKYAVNGSDFGFDLAAPLPELATGTNYVPYDGMQAVLHRGEAVVPAKYNPAAGGSRSGMTQHNTIYIDGRMDQASTAQLINQALQANNRAWEERMAAQGRR